MFCDSCGAPQLTMPLRVATRAEEFRVREPYESAFPRNRWAVAALLILCLAISTSLIAVYYYVAYQELLRGSRGTSIQVNLGINYGAGKATVWFNGTNARKGNTLLDLTKAVAAVDGTEYPGAGTFVNSINGVKNAHPRYWMWWMWTKGQGWVLGPLASDRYVAGDGETLLWYYEDTSVTPLPKPP